MEDVVRVLRSEMERLQQCGAYQGWAGGGFIGFTWNHIFCVIDEPAVNIKDFIFISFSFLTLYDRCGT